MRWYLLIYVLSAFDASGAELHCIPYSFDIVAVLDGNRELFKNQILLLNLAGQLHFPHQRLGIVQWGSGGKPISKASLEPSLQTFGELSSQIASVVPKKDEDGSNTVEILERAFVEIAKYPSQVTLIVLFSDGNGLNLSSVDPVRSRLRQLNAELFAVISGDQSTVNFGILARITGDTKRVFTENNLDQLQALIKTLAKQETCHTLTPPTTQPSKVILSQQRSESTVFKDFPTDSCVDIAFVLSIGSEETQWKTSVIKAFLQAASNGIRIGIVVNGRNLEGFATPSKEEGYYEEKLAQFSHETASRLSDSVKIAAEEFRLKARSAAAKLVIVLVGDAETDASNNNYEDLRAGQSLNLLGVETFVLSSASKSRTGKSSISRLVNRDVSRIFDRDSMEGFANAIRHVFESSKCVSITETTTKSAPREDLQRVTFQATRKPSTGLNISTANTFPATRISFAAPQKITVSTQTRSCPKCLQTEPVDMLILVDTTSKDSNVWNMKRVVNQLVESLPISDCEIRIALIQYSSLPTMTLRFDADQSKEHIKKRIEALSPSSASHSSTTAAVQYGVNVLLSDARKEAKKIVVLITDGDSSDPWPSILTPSYRLQLTADLVFALSPEHNIEPVQYQELLQYAGSEDRVFTSAMRDTDALKEILASIKFNKCPGKPLILPQTLPQSTTKLTTTATTAKLITKGATKETSTKLTNQATTTTSATTATTRESTTRFDALITGTRTTESIRTITTEEEQKTAIFTSGKPETTEPFTTTTKDAATTEGFSSSDTSEASTTTTMKITKETKRPTTNPSYCGSLSVDIMLVIDTTAASKIIFMKHQEMASEIIRSLPNSPDYRIALTVIHAKSGATRVEFPFSKYSEREQVLKRIRGLHYEESTSSLTFAMLLAIQHLAEEKRADARPMVIIFSDGQSNDPWQIIKSVSQSLKSTRTTTFAISYSLVINEAELEEYTGSQDHIFLEFRAPEFLAVFEHFIKTPTCTSTTVVPTTVTMDPTETNTIIAADPTCKLNQKTNLVIVLDTSIHTKDTFLLSKDILLLLLHMLPVEQEGFRTMLITFNSETSIVLDGSISKRDEILSAVFALKQTEARKQQFPQAIQYASALMNARKETDSKELLLLVTNGIFIGPTPEELRQVADNITADSKISLSLNLGKPQDQLRNLTKLVFEKTSVSEFYTTIWAEVCANPFPGFESEFAPQPKLATAKATEIVSKRPCKPELDLMMIFDASGRSEVVFKRQLALAVDILTALPDSRSFRLAIALIRFSGVATLDMEFNERHSKEEVINFIRQLEYTGGNSALAFAVLLATREIQRGRRSDAELVVIIMSDGKSDDDWSTVLERSKGLVATGAEIYAISLAESSAERELQQYTGSERRVYLRSKTQEFLVDLQFFLIEKVCAATEKISAFKEDSDKPTAKTFLVSPTSDTSPSAFIDYDSTPETTEKTEAIPTKSPPQHPTTKSVSCPLQRNIVFLWDITKTSMIEQQKKFMRKMVQKYRSARIGVIVYDNSPKVLFGLKTRFSLQKRLMRISEIKVGQKDQSDLAKAALFAVRLAKNQGQNQESLLFLISDGATNEQWDTVNRAVASVERSFTHERTFAFSFNPVTHFPTLMLFTSCSCRIFQPNTTKEMLSSLDNSLCIEDTTEEKPDRQEKSNFLSSHIQEKSVPQINFPGDPKAACVHRRRKELVMLIDGSRNFQQQYNRQILSATRIVKALNQGQVRFTIATFAEIPQLVVGPTEELTSQEIEKRLRGLTFVGGPSFVARALDYTLSMRSLSVINSDRLVVLLSDGTSDDDWPTLQTSVKTLKALNPKLYAVNVLDKSNLPQLLLFTDNSDRIFQSHQIGVFLTTITKEICEGQETSFPVGNCKGAHEMDIVLLIEASDASVFPLQKAGATEILNQMFSFSSEGLIRTAIVYFGQDPGIFVGLEATNPSSIMTDIPSLSGPPKLAKAATLGSDILMKGRLDARKIVIILASGAGTEDWRSIKSSVASLTSTAHSVYALSFSSTINEPRLLLYTGCKCRLFNGGNRAEMYQQLATEFCSGRPTAKLSPGELSPTLPPLVSPKEFQKPDGNNFPNQQLPSPVTGKVITKESPTEGFEITRETIGTTETFTDDPTELQFRRRLVLPSSADLCDIRGDYDIFLLLDTSSAHFQDRKLLAIDLLQSIPFQVGKTRISLIAYDSRAGRIRFPSNTAPINYLSTLLTLTPSNDSQSDSVRAVAKALKFASNNSRPIIVVLSDQVPPNNPNRTKIVTDRIQESNNAVVYSLYTSETADRQLFNDLTGCDCRVFGQENSDGLIQQLTKTICNRNLSSTDDERRRRTEESSKLNKAQRVTLPNTKTPPVTKIDSEARFATHQLNPRIILATTTPFAVPKLPERRRGSTKAQRTTKSIIENKFTDVESREITSTTQLPKVEEVTNNQENKTIATELKTNNEDVAQNQEMTTKSSTDKKSTTNEAISTLSEPKNEEEEEGNEPERNKEINKKIHSNGNKASQIMSSCEMKRPTELLILIDTSSMVPDEFELRKMLTKTLLQSLPINNGRFRVSLVSYATKPKVVIGFRSNYSLDEMLSKADRIRGERVSANTAKTVYFAAKSWEKIEDKNRRNTSKIMVLLSDGGAQDTFNKVRQAVETLKEVAHSVYSLTLSDTPFLPRLLVYTGCSCRVFNKESIDQFLETLGTELCVPVTKVPVTNQPLKPSIKQLSTLKTKHGTTLQCPVREKTSLVILVDASANLKDHFDAQKNVLSEILQFFPDSTNLTSKIVLFSEKAEKLSQNSSSNSIVGLKYKGGEAHLAGAVEFGMASLDNSTANIFILLTDGNSDDIWDRRHSAARKLAEIAPNSVFAHPTSPQLYLPNLLLYTGCSCRIFSHTTQLFANLTQKLCTDSKTKGTVSIVAEEKVRNSKPDNPKCLHLSYTTDIYIAIDVTSERYLEEYLEIKDRILRAIPFSRGVRVGLGAIASSPEFIYRFSDPQQRALIQAKKFTARSGEKRDIAKALNRNFPGNRTTLFVLLLNDLQEEEEAVVRHGYYIVSAGENVGRRIENLYSKRDLPKFLEKLKSILRESAQCNFA